MATRPRRRRVAKSASPPNPATIMAQVEGSGTAVIDPKSPASEADRDLVERLAVVTGARSLSEAIRGAIRNEFARLSK
jgi:hypothetical protein